MCLPLINSSTGIHCITTTFNRKCETVILFNDMKSNLSLVLLIYLFNEQHTYTCYVHMYSIGQKSWFNKFVLNLKSLSKVIWKNTFCEYKLPFVYPSLIYFMAEFLCVVVQMKKLQANQNLCSLWWKFQTNRIIAVIMETHVFFMSIRRLGMFYFWL